MESTLAAGCESRPLVHKVDLLAVVGVGSAVRSWQVHANAGVLRMIWNSEPIARKGLPETSSRLNRASTPPLACASSLLPTGIVETAALASATRRKQPVFIAMAGPARCLSPGNARSIRGWRADAYHRGNSDTRSTRLH